VCSNRDPERVKKEAGGLGEGAQAGVAAGPVCGGNPPTSQRSYSFVVSGTSVDAMTSLIGVTRAGHGVHDTYVENGTSCGVANSRV
jgi:hypothetical protein